MSRFPMSPPSHWTTPRHKAALKRAKLGAPYQSAIAHSIITPDTTVLDYGCGRGDNVRFMVEQGINAVGYDPYYFPDTEKTESDVVALCYVLGVIESPAERDRTLSEAWSLAKKSLLVATQVQKSRGDVVHGDGYITRWATFARYWTSPQFREYVETITKAKATRLGKGIIFLSKE